MRDHRYIKLVGSLLLVVLISSLVFSRYGFLGSLSRDDAIYLYGGQQMAKGVPPYVSIFDHKGPLASMVSGMGVMLSQILNVSDVIGVRMTFLGVSLLAIIGLYLLAFDLFEDSYEMAFLTSFAFINFWGFGRHAVSGPDAKTVMVLFQVLALWLTVRQKWFWAGLCGVLAFLSWQPTVIYPFLTSLLAIVQSKAPKDRMRNVSRTLTGMVIPLVIISLYFSYHGAFWDFIDGLILFNIVHLNRPWDTSLLNIVAGIVGALLSGYTTMIVPMLMGFASILLVLMRRMRMFKNDLFMWLRSDRFAILLLSFPFPFLWSLLDFQWYPDFYVFLPYAAIGFGWFLHQALSAIVMKSGITVLSRKLFFMLLCGILVFTATVNYHLTTSDGMRLQQQWANEITARFGENIRCLSIGIPQALVLLHEKNPNPYVFIINGIDNYIDAKTSDGIDGWIAEVEQYEPDVIFYGPTNGRFVSKLESWLESTYRTTTIGEWKIYFSDRASLN